VKEKKTGKKTQKPSFYLRTVFWLLTAVLALILGLFFVPLIGEIFKGPPFLIPFVVFFFLGGLLLFLTLKEGIQGRLKKFLILTGASSVGLLVGILLHNFLYAAAILTSQIVILAFLFEILHGFFFLLATIACPLGCLIGVLASAVLIIREHS
jgi:hypothetical protein